LERLWGKIIILIDIVIGDCNVEIQKQILLFFSSIHNDFLNLLVQGITIFGEQLLLIAFAVFVYWNLDKKKGYTISMTILNSVCVMGMAKAIVRFPRPWTVIDGLETVRQQTATGYSFPSGHTTSAASAYSAIAIAFKKRWVSILCAIMIALVGLSRLYLCVHWPMDVAGGILIGCGVAFLLGSRIARLYDDKANFSKVMMIVGIVSTLVSIVMTVLLMMEKIDAIAFEDLTLSFAIYGGLGIGISIERRVFDFNAQDVGWGKKILRYIIGMFVVAVIMVGLKEVFKALGIVNMITRTLRYFLIGIWCCIYPIIGRKIGLFKA